MPTLTGTARPAHNAPAANKVRVGVKIKPRTEGPREIQDIAYLLATNKISEADAMALYEKLWNRSRDTSLLSRIRRALFPSLGA